MLLAHEWHRGGEVLAPAQDEGGLVRRLVHQSAPRRKEMAHVRAANEIRGETVYGAGGRQVNITDR